MKTQNLTVAMGFLLLLLIASCSKESNKSDGSYTINGIVKSPNLSKVIGNAHLYADSKSSGHETRSDAQGNFKLTLPIGAHTIFVETGDGALFQNTFQVSSFLPNEEIAIPETQSILRQRGQLAYIAGSYDQIETVVRDTLGFTISEIQTSDLDDSVLLSGYGAIFINCGATQISGAPSANGYANLGNFVARGGSIYASDFAMDYLVGESDASCAPSGGFIDDSKICTSRTGLATTLSGCQVVDPGLQTALGTTTVDVTYDLPQWSKASQFDNVFWTTDISDVTNGPLLLHTDQYTNSTGTSAGKIYWTTFHNEYNSTISNTSETILEYVILHL